MLDKQKGDAGHNLSFALDLLVRLDETVTRSLSFNECLSISRNQVHVSVLTLLPAQACRALACLSSSI